MHIATSIIKLILLVTVRGIGSGFGLKTEV